MSPVAVVTTAANLVEWLAPGATVVEVQVVDFVCLPFISLKSHDFVYFKISSKSFFVDVLHYRSTHASKVLEQLTGQTPVTSNAHYTVRTFGIHHNEQNRCARYHSWSQGRRDPGAWVESEGV